MGKKLKLKIPKRVGGVKIPKAVRKGAIMDFLNSRAGQMVVAEALVVLAGVLTTKGAATDAGSGKTLARESHRVSGAFGDALSAFRAALERTESKTDQAGRQSDTAPASH